MAAEAGIDHDQTQMHHLDWPPGQAHVHERERVERDRGLRARIVDDGDDGIVQPIALAAEHAVFELALRQDGARDGAEVIEQRLERFGGQRDARPLDDAQAKAAAHAHAELEAAPRMGRRHARAAALAARKATAPPGRRSQNSATARPSPWPSQNTRIIANVRSMCSSWTNSGS